MAYDNRLTTNKMHKADIHTAYGHATIERASDQPAQHDEAAIAKWEQKFIPPTRRLW